MSRPNFDQLRDHWGKPIVIEGGVTAPKVAALPKSAGSEMNAIYQETWAKALAATVVTRRGVEETVRGAPQALFATAESRVGARNNFYLTNSGGNNLFLANTGRTDTLQSLAADHIYEPLAARTLGIASHPREHLIAMADITVPSNGVVFETGAGEDWARIKALEWQAKARGSQLICHDLLPSVTHRAAKEVPSVAYMAMHPLPDLLAACLEPIRGKPLTISLKDTVSSMAFGAMQLLFDLAQRTEAEQVVVTQSVGFSPNANVFPDGLRPMSEQMSAQFLPMLLSSGRFSPELAIVAVQQAHTSLTSIMFEVVNYYLRKFAQDAGLPYSEVYTTTHTTIVGEKDEKGLLKVLNFSHAEDLWRAGGFNNLVFTPFGVHKSNERDVESGKLRITTNQLHLRFGKTPAPSGANSRKLGEDELLSPRTALLADLIDTTDLIKPIRNLRKTQDILRDPRKQREIRDMQKLGIEMALRVTFSLYPQIIPYVASLPTEERDRIISWYRSAAV